MSYLYWTFDWNAKKAEAVSAEGRYIIEGDDQAKWTARFKKGTDRTDVIPRDDGRHTLTFETLSDALRACQRHCDRKSSDTSGRLTIRTPLPG